VKTHRLTVHFLEHDQAVDGALLALQNRALLSGPGVRDLVDCIGKRLTRTLSSQGIPKRVAVLHHRTGVETRASDDLVGGPCAFRSQCPPFVVDFDVHRRVSRVALSPEVGGEVQGVATVVPVVLVGSPLHAEGVQTVEEVAAEGGHGNTVLTAGHADDEVVSRRIIVGHLSEHGVAFVVDLLAGSSEGVARSCGLAELDVAVIICFDSEDKLVDLIARLRGELE
jgi:hypothetical protein